MENNFEFFEDDEEDTRLDLIEIQKRIFTQIFNLCPQSSSDSGSTADDDNEVEIGDG